MNIHLSRDIGYIVIFKTHVALEWIDVDSDCPLAEQRLDDLFVLQSILLEVAPGDVE